jgi:hypothetical protein
MDGEASGAPISAVIQMRVAAVEDVFGDFGVAVARNKAVVGLVGGTRWAFLAPAATLGELIQVPECMALEVPVEMSNAVACALVSAGVSAQFVTHTLMPVWPGATILVSSRPSRVMELAITMARLKGATVMGETLRDEETLFLSRTHTSLAVFASRDFDIAYVARTGPWPAVVAASMKSTGCIIDFIPRNEPRLLRGPFVMRPPLPDIVADQYEFPGRAAMVFRMYREGKLGLSAEFLRL